MDKASFSGSKHFVIHNLADGVFAAIASNGGWAICNAGLINLGGQLLVFDTFVTPQAAQDLKQFALDFFGRSPQLVINSHYHNDHIWGNQAFAPDASILSNIRTRELILTAGREELDWNAANAELRLASLRAKYANTNDPRQRQELSLWIGEYEGIAAALPVLNVCAPGITFDGRLELFGGKSYCELLTYTGGHTACDTILYLPQEGIVFMADLLFVGCHPYLADGDPESLLAALRDISRLDARYFVPGHGPVGTGEDVKLLIAYIEDCLEVASRLVKGGSADEDAITALVVPAPFQSWQLSQFYQTNVRFLCERLVSAHSTTG